MGERFYSRVLVAGFSLALAIFASESIGPPFEPEYVVHNQGPALSAAERGSWRRLYLRRTVHLPHPTESAWLAALGPDSLQLYVNGQVVASQQESGETVAVLADLAPQLRVGRNVIAIEAVQRSRDRRLAVAVDGSYSLRDGEHGLGADASWRASSDFEYERFYWFSENFDDSHWLAAELREIRYSAAVQSPPRAYRRRDAVGWLGPDFDESLRAVLRREFDFRSHPGSGWISLVAETPYRIAVNGTVVDQEEASLATGRRPRATRNVYDLTPYLSRGRNVVAVALMGTGGAPRIRISGEVEDAGSRRISLDASDQWLEHAGVHPGWVERRLEDPDSWHRASMNTGPMESVLSEVGTRFVPVSIPVGLRIERYLRVAAFAILFGVATRIACRRFANHLSTIRGRRTEVPPVAAVHFTLLPTTLAAVGAHLAVFDSRIHYADVYRGVWLLGLLGIVPLQWWLLARSARRPEQQAKRSFPAIGAEMNRRLAHLGVALLLVVGLVLRIHGIGTEDLHLDETNVYRATQGFFEFGFPGFRVSEDLPVGKVATSELIYLGTALAGLLFDQDHLVVRGPPVVFGTLTILLIYLAGSAMFCRSVGLVAAAWYTLAPSSIALTHFGRYFAQLQLLTLLTVYLTYVALRGRGRVRTSLLWALAISFSAMFLSWEGVITVAPGLALGALILRWGRLRSVLTDPSVWAAFGCVIAVPIFQTAHRSNEQVQRLVFGTGASDVALRPIWTYPMFDPGYYFWESSWIEDALLPMLGLLAAGLMALRHPWHRSTRFLLAVFVSTALLMTAVMSVRAPRYADHLTPLAILLAASAVVACWRGLHTAMIESWSSHPPRAWTALATGACAVFLIGGVALGSGITLRLSEMSGQRTSPTQAEFPDHRPVARFLREHVREGDVVIADAPHGVQNHFDRAVDYWLETRLHHQAVLGDQTDTPLQRWVGTKMVSSLDELKDVFGRYDRVWYVSVPMLHDSLNQDVVSSYITTNMDVAYRNVFMLILSKGAHTRSLETQLQDEKILEASRASFLKP